MPVSRRQEVDAVTSVWSHRRRPRPRTRAWMLVDISASSNNHPCPYFPTMCVCSVYAVHRPNPDSVNLSIHGSDLHYNATSSCFPPSILGRCKDTFDFRPPLTFVPHHISIISAHSIRHFLLCINHLSPFALLVLIHIFFLAFVASLFLPISRIAGPPRFVSASHRPSHAPLYHSLHNPTKLIQ